MIEGLDRHASCESPSRVWSVGPSLTETISDAGVRRATVQRFQATYDHTRANYRETVRTAFRQVEDNLAALGALIHGRQAFANAKRLEVLGIGGPFFSKRGAGIFLHVKIVGNAADPLFGLDPGGTGPKEQAENAAAQTTIR